MGMNEVMRGGLPCSAQHTPITRLLPLPPKDFCQSLPTQILAGGLDSTCGMSGWVTDAVCGHA